MQFARLRLSCPGQRVAQQMETVRLRLAEKPGDGLSNQGVAVNAERLGGGVGLDDQTVSAQGAIADRRQVVEVEVARARSPVPPASVAVRRSGLPFRPVVHVAQVSIHTRR